MNTEKIILGMALIIFGLSLTIRKIITFVKGEQGSFGYDAQGLVLRIGCAICGVILVTKYI